MHPEVAHPIEAVLRKQGVIPIAVGADLVGLLLENMLGVVGSVPPPSSLDPLHHGPVGLDLVGLALDVLLGLSPEHVRRGDGVVDVVGDHALAAASVRGWRVSSARDLRIQRFQHALHDALERLPGVSPLGDLGPALQDEGVVVCLQRYPGVDLRERGVGVVVDPHGLVVVGVEVPDYVQADPAPVARGQRGDHQEAAVALLRALV
mmetsp:Transcript_53314/g.155334  ORF Transcript_53314/g.155334 Transcript_53314/m.155334 type:complete len:206 (-) Transcript_53314:383-1000(-)